MSILATAEAVNDEQAAKCSEQINGAIDTSQQPARLLTEANTLLEKGREIISESVNAAELLHELSAT